MLGCGRSLDKPSTDYYDRSVKLCGNPNYTTYLGAGDGKEANTHQHTADGDLAVTELDTIQVDDTQTVSTDQTVQSENLVHLDSRNESATTLAENVGDGNDISQLAGEGSGNGRITQLDGRGLAVIQFLFHHGSGELVGKASRGNLSLLLSLLLGVCVLLLQSLGTGRCDSRDGLGTGSDRGTLALHLTLHSLFVVRVAGTLGIQMGDLDGNRGRGLVESLHHRHLLLIQLLHLGGAVVFSDSGEIILGAVQKRNTDVGLLESANIVGAITAHQSGVASILETEKNIFLLLRGNTSVDPGVAKEVRKRLLALELGQSISSEQLRP